MEISIVSQLINTLSSALLGIFIGLIYEVFGIFRILLGLEETRNKLYLKIASKKLPLINGDDGKKNTNKAKSKIEGALFFILDLMFFLFITPIVLIFIYATSNGIVRWYIFVGGFAGFLIYCYTLRKILNPLIHILLYYIKVAVCYLWYLIKIPLKKVKPFFAKKLIFLKSKISLKIKKLKRRPSKVNIENKVKKEKSILATYGKIDG